MVSIPQLKVPQWAAWVITIASGIVFVALAWSYIYLRIRYGKW